MNIKEYLNRINYEGEIKLNIEVLKELQKCHLLNVPFENLDIHYNRTIQLDIGKFYNKIVIDRRGGFCYELNTLFQNLLHQIGFKKIISARVYDHKKGSFGEEYDHLAIVVDLNQRAYLVDVGFGEFAF
ncbi:MAG: arylamine N-acetyltransferase, partial [Bacteroidota bacterium]